MSTTAAATSHPTLPRTMPTTEQMVARIGPGHPNTTIGHHIGMTFPLLASDSTRLPDTIWRVSTLSAQ